MDLVGQLGPRVETVERVEERAELRTPELGVRAVRDTTGQGSGVVLLERLVPGGEMTPVRAVERPHDALGGADPALQVLALVDVGDDAEGLGQAVADEVDQLGALHVLRAARVDRDLRERPLVTVGLLRRGLERSDHDRGPEVLAVLHPLERRRDARVVDVAARAASVNAGSSVPMSAGSARPMSFSWMTNSLPSLPQGGAWRRGMVDLGAANRDRRMAGIA